MMRGGAGFKFAVLAVSFLALAACSKKNTPDLESNANPGGDGAGNGGQYSPGSKGEFDTEVGNTVYYLVDQSTLTEEGKDTLRKQAAWLQRYEGVKVQVEGHADERGTREYNIALSARRATASRNFLISQGIDGTRVDRISFGKERPVALCDSEECFSQNRRTVTVITGGASE
jgi:peptidoglycan-associated lipoprotein